MAKSKQRKGHNQKIQERNKQVNREQKMFQESMLKHIEELKKKFESESGKTENTDTNEMGLI